MFVCLVVLFLFPEIFVCFINLLLFFRDLYGCLVCCYFPRYFFVWSFCYCFPRYSPVLSLFSLFHEIFVCFVFFTVTCLFVSRDICLFYCYWDICLCGLFFAISWDICLFCFFDCFPRYLSFVVVLFLLPEIFVCFVISVFLSAYSVGPWTCIMSLEMVVSFFQDNWFSFKFFFSFYILLIYQVPHTVTSPYLACQHL